MMREGMDGRMHPSNPREPLIHSGVTDVLPDDHPLAFTSLDCDNCGMPIHAFNNECMATWVETGRGNFCLECFVRLYTNGDDCECCWGLPRMTLTDDTAATVRGSPTGVSADA